MLNPFCYMEISFFKKNKPAKLSTLDLTANDDDGLGAINDLLRTLENAHGQPN